MVFLIKKYLYVILVSCFIILGYIFYKYYQYQRFFLREDYYENSLLHNGALLTFLKSNAINELDNDLYLDYIFEFNQFEEINKSFYIDQLFLEKVMNDSMVTYSVGFKGEDNEIGGRKYYYLGNEKELNVKNENFGRFLLQDRNYDIVFSSITIKNNNP